MQAIIDRLRKVSGPVLSAILFALAFALGLLVFAISGSVTISAFAMAITSLASALAARELTPQSDPHQIKALVQDETRAHARQLGHISDRIIEIEAEIRQALKERALPERIRLDALARDIDEISSILGNLVAIIQAQDAQSKSQSDRRSGSDLRKPITPRRDAMMSAGAQVQMDGRLKPAAKPGHALAALQMENILREDMMQGRLKIHLHDVMHMNSGRVQLRSVQCALEGRLPEFRTDLDLIARGISPGIIQLFDRMRFGFAYEFASQFGQHSGSAPILCPLMDATFASSSAADEIVGMIEAHPHVAQNLVVALGHLVLSEPNDEEQDRLHRLRDADVALAVMLGQDFSLDPAQLHAQGVRYAMADAALLIGRNGQTPRSTIHPADLASYLNRHDILLMAEGAASAADVKALKSIGVDFASGPALVKTKSASDRTLRAADLLGPSDDLHPDGTQTRQLPDRPTAPLRDHLRRVRT